MSVIHIHKHLDSETLHLPELKALVGKNVEIIIREDMPPAPGASAFETRAELAGQDVKDLVAHEQPVDLTLATTCSTATPATVESPEQADLRRLRLLLEEQEAHNRACRDEEIRELLED